MDQSEVAPDERIIEQVFGAHKPETTSIIDQDLEKCVFKATFPSATENHHPPCVVRLEASSKHCPDLTKIAAVQRMAAAALPDLVPKTIQVGKATNSEGRIFHFSVIEFVDGNTLEDVWKEMDPNAQETIVSDIAAAVKTLHRIRLQVSAAGGVAPGGLLSPAETDIATDICLFGGPLTGFLTEGPALLKAVREFWKLKKDFCTEDGFSVPHNVIIRSKFEELGSIMVSDVAMAQWPREAVLCHNDLTPRNFIIQSDTSPDGKANYRLAAIIDWEAAGFYPPSYELSLQDTYLSGGHRHLSFYLLLKEHLREITPISSSQIALCQAMALVFESQQKLLSNGSNVPANIRKRFIEQFHLIRSPHPYVVVSWSFLNFCDDFLGGGLGASGAAFRRAIPVFSSVRTVEFDDDEVKASLTAASPWGSALKESPSFDTLPVLLRVTGGLVSAGLACLTLAVGRRVGTTIPGDCEHIDVGVVSRLGYGYWPLRTGELVVVDLLLRAYKEHFFQADPWKGALEYLGTGLVLDIFEWVELPADEP
ncbi:hypothetical protein NUW58_g2520 [Xylaria curta]|uniref:Uncharacterized protein n=1 Tax=Xylaria curta TaxID=42375 RepID=A0ACC1PHX2_9PEZI|nr:hypothetical protein NUW58_g2520 [Xylaria curta]